MFPDLTKHLEFFEVCFHEFHFIIEELKIELIMQPIKCFYLKASFDHQKAKSMGVIKPVKGECLLKDCAFFNSADVPS